MKISAFPDRRLVSAEEVCLVLDNAKRLTHQQWADEFGVGLVTIQAWRRKGYYAGLWSAPSAVKWNGLKADAVQALRAKLAVLTGNRRS